MLIAIVGLQIVALIVMAVILVRAKSQSQATPEDARLTHLLAAQLPEKFGQMDARSAALDQHLRAELSQLRSEVVRTVSELGTAQGLSLDRFRADSKGEAERLRAAVDAQIAALGQRFIGFTSEATQHHRDTREALQSRLNELGSAQTEHQEKLRGVVEARLDALNVTNTAKLEEMRRTVDEKLEATLHTRLTASFGQIADQLTKVHTGLGEMSSLATGVGDLKKVLSNVKARGIVGEFFLGQQLEQMFSSDQYEANKRIKAGSLETVEYALRVPNGPDSTLLLSIDSKFPLGDWERLEEAYEKGTDEDRKRAGVAFEAAIRKEGKKICEKYIDPETTLPFAIMYLPTEALYAEVMRRPGLHAELQAQCKVVIAGPSAFTMILTSFQMVFRTLKFQKNLNEIWKVFQVAQSEFEKFGGLMEKVERNVGTVQTTLKEISGKTKTVNRAFRNASHLNLEESSSASRGFDGLLPMLAAADDDA